MIEPFQAAGLIQMRGFGAREEIRSSSTTSRTRSNRRPGTRYPYPSPNQGHHHASATPASTNEGARHRRFPGETSCLTLVWAVLDLLITHQTNGIHFNALDRQRLKRARYQGNQQTIPEEVTAA
jgi:hypothetical protein